VLGRIVKERNWLRGMPECPFLAEHNIAHTGILHARRPYEIVRIDQTGTFMLACLVGEGVVMVDGSWKTISAGQACLLPPFVKNSLKCTSERTWRFAWVRYEESRDAKPIVSSVSPIIGAFDGTGLGAAITGLHQEAAGVNNPAALHQWCELVHHYVMRFAEPSNLDERLWRLWSQVEKDPSRDWMLDDLAKITCLSAEHLRRLCLREIGRSPMRHLTFIRLHIALNLLSTSADKIDTIARAVGFSGIHSFSNAFRARFGRTPSEFR
jgi:AraC-like DNA-binding protein